MHVHVYNTLHTNVFISTRCSVPSYKWFFVISFFLVKKAIYIESSLLRKIMFIKIFKSKFSWYIFNNKNNKKGKKKNKVEIDFKKSYSLIMHSSMSYNHLCTFNVQHHIKISLAQIKVCIHFKNIYQARF